MKLAWLTLAGLAMACVTLLQSPSAFADGIGAYPPDLNVADAARGSVYYKDFGVINSEPTDLIVQAIPAGEVGSWTTIVTVDDRNTPLPQVIIPAGETASLLARIAVPDDASNGPHEGGLTLQSLGPPSPVDTGGGGTVIPAVELNMDVNISGEQNLAGKVLDMYTNDTEVNYPLRVTTYFSNIGNVNATPNVIVRIKDANSNVIGDSNNGNSTEVSPSETAFIVNTWDTTGNPVGDYVADVVVNLGDATIEERTLNFKILPYGTLTRRGSLESLTLESPAEVGTTAKIEATFRNSGIIDTRAIFQGEIYLDGNLLTAVTTPEKLVAPSDLGVFEIFTEIKDTGNYVVRGKINYEGKETDERELSFSVSEGTSLALFGGIAAGAIIVLGVGIATPLLLRRRRAKKRVEEAPTES